MKRSTKRIGVLLPFLVMMLGGCDSKPPGRPALRLLTWNIHGCADGLAAVCTDAERIGADLVCLQEAEVGTRNTGGADQAARIARALRMQHFAAGSPVPGGGEQRMAILFRGALQEREVLDAGTGRFYGVSALLHWRDTPVRVVCVHLTSSYRLDPAHLIQSSHARLAEAAHLADRLGQWTEPVVVAGDFNATPGMPAYTTLAARLSPAPGSQPTYPSHGPAVRIDHVFHGSGIRVERIDVVEIRSSDHLPVVAELKLH